MQFKVQAKTVSNAIISESSNVKDVSAQQVEFAPEMTSKKRQKLHWGLIQKKDGRGNPTCSTITTLQFFMDGTAVGLFETSKRNQTSAASALGTGKEAMVPDFQWRGPVGIFKGDIKSRFQQRSVRIS